MRAVDVYLMYCALKAHFSGDYDYHKFSGQTRIKRDSFYKRKDRFFFVKTSYKYKQDNEVLDYFVANFIKDREGYIANFNEKIMKNGLINEKYFMMYSLKNFNHLLKNLIHSLNQRMVNIHCF